MFYLSTVSRCLVDASVPRCRVVPSVTLGTGGINSPVGRRGAEYGNATFCRSVNTGCLNGLFSARFSRSRILMNCATPEPIIEKAGMSIQNHQPCPVDLESAIAISKKAMPMKMLLKARSSVTGFSCFFPIQEVVTSGSIGCSG